MRSHARRRNRPEDANAWWSSTASDHTTFARFMASNVSTFSRASRSRICVRGSARASNRGAPRFCFCFRESLASFARRCHAVATFTVFISRHSRATTAKSASAVVHDETKVQEGRAKRSSDLTRRPKKRLVARLGKTSRPNRFAGGADACVPSTHWMIRLLMATKPRTRLRPTLGPCSRPVYSRRRNAVGRRRPRPARGGRGVREVSGRAPQTRARATRPSARHMGGLPRGTNAGRRGGSHPPVRPPGSAHRETTSAVNSLRGGCSRKKKTSTRNEHSKLFHLGKPKEFHLTVEPYRR